MNIQNLMSQLMASSNPMSMMMGMLNPSQKQIVNNFSKKNKQEQYEEIAKMCNEKGIKKNDLEQIIRLINNK